MDLSKETEDYIKATIDHSLGLSVSNRALELKLLVSEEAQNRLHGQLSDLQIRFEEKDELVDCARAEASLNARAVKKFVEENQKLAMECTDVLGQCESLEKECSLYDKDREALMEFGNEADERARKAEIRVSELEAELSRITREVQSYKHQHEVDISLEGLAMEQHLVDSLLTTLAGNEVTVNTHAFLEANGGVESFQKLFEQWNSLRPSTQKVMAVASRLKTLVADKDHLRMNLSNAEEEVKLLFKENKILNNENKRLTRQQKEKCHSGSGERCTSTASAKGNKRKFSLIEGKLDFNEGDSPRKPLSLQCNSPGARMIKK